jgi:hypothetical protein
MAVVGTVAAESGRRRDRSGRIGNSSGGTESGRPAHAIAQATGVRRSDGRDSDARATETPMDCLRVDAGTSLKGAAGQGDKGKKKKKKKYKKISCEKSKKRHDAPMDR